eukprot:IDg10051t1
MPIDSSLVTPPITSTENNTHQECQDVPTLNIPPSGAFSRLQRLQCVLNFLKKELVVNDYTGTVEEQIKDLSKTQECTQKILHWITREGETSNRRYQPGSDLQEVYAIGSVEELEEKLRNDMLRRTLKSKKPNKRGKIQSEAQGKVDHRDACCGVARESHSQRQKLRRRSAQVLISYSFAKEAPQ